MAFDPKEAERLLIKDRNKYIRFYFKVLKDHVENKRYDLAENTILEGAKNLNSIVGAIDYFESAGSINSYPIWEPVFYTLEDDEEEE